jgi:predicted HicB family RNase H-like nuclease
MAVNENFEVGNVAQQIHAAVAIAAEVRGKSINQWATETLAHAVNQ